MRKPLPSRRLIAGLLAGSLMVWTVPMTGAANPAPVQGTTHADASSGRQDSVQPHWEQVRSSMARGEYREALRELDAILSLTPDDPRASAYKQLCQKRLSATSQLRALTPSELTAMQESLRREQQEQARSSAQTAALDRQVAKEQAKWDAELKRLHQQTEREERTKEREERLRERRSVRLAKQEEGQRRQLAKQPVVPAPSAVPQPSAPAPQLAQPTPETAPQPPTGGAPTAPTSAEEAPTPPPTTTEVTPPPLEMGIPPSEPEVPSPEQPSVELVPVTVPTAPRAGAPRPLAKAQPVEVPPGAVRIFADQLSDSPIRKLAMAQGHVRVFFHDGMMTCDKATVFTDTQDVYAQGRVRLERGTDVFRGEVIHYNIRTHKGRFLEGTAIQVSKKPVQLPGETVEATWYEHGRVVEHIAEGVLRLRPGYITTCEFEPPHFRFQGRQATVFTDERLTRSRNVTFLVEEIPFIYFPWLSLADRKTPFFFVPGKRKPWGPFALSGYRYEWPAGNRGTLQLDWRRYFLWGLGLSDQFETKNSKGLLKVYFNQHKPLLEPKESLVKGADRHRYRVLFRHNWQLMPDTQVVTDIQKLSDQDFRKDFLFREEYVSDDQPESFISMITTDPNVTLNMLVKRRLNRFQSVTEAFPDASAEVTSKQIGNTSFFVNSRLGVSNLHTEVAHSDATTDVTRIDWFQQLRYAMDLFRPILVTPNIGIRQTFYNKDKQGGAERPDGDRNFFSGQFSSGADASLTLFQIFPVTTNFLGLNINHLRHVLMPTLSYSYIHPPTVAQSNLSFPASSNPTNLLTGEIENKLQTKRFDRTSGKMQSVDLGRLLITLPYTFRGGANKQGGRLGNWVFDLETYPWSWLRLESDLTMLSHFAKRNQDGRIPSWNLDLVMVGGRENAQAKNAPKVPYGQNPYLSDSTTDPITGSPSFRAFQQGPQFTTGVPLLPQGQWYIGLGHRYSQNSKTESVLEFDWRISEKWQVGTFQRFTWKEVAGSAKRFNNHREFQYTLTRDLHDWVAEVVYHVDREFGEELFFTMTLKAYPEMPIKTGDSYHQPKIGSQSSPFSPIHVQSP